MRGFAMRLDMYQVRDRRRQRRCFGMLISDAPRRQAIHAPSTPSKRARGWSVNDAAVLHRRLDRAYLNALARDGSDHGHAHALVASRNRHKGQRSMSGPQQHRVLFAMLAECTSARGLEAVFRMC
jgi:hypothetical protein